MTEDQLLANVLDLCRLTHVRTAHFRPARTATGWRTAVSGDGKGFPDLVLVGNKGVLFRELKSDKGRPDTEQAVWLERLRAAGANVGVWRPDDLHAGSILHEIQAVA